MVAHACNLSTQKREGDFQMFEASLHCTVRLSWCDFCCTDKQHNQKKKKIKEDRDVFILKFTSTTGGMQNWSRSQGGAQLAACLSYTPRLAFLYSSGPPAAGGMAQCLSPPHKSSVRKRPHRTAYGHLMKAVPQLRFPLPR